MFRYYKNDSVRPSHTCDYSENILTELIGLLVLLFLQDKEPAGIIFAEDIQDVLQDLEEAQKDIAKVCHDENIG